MTVTAHQHVLTEPASGEIIDLPVGACLEVKFRRPRMGLTKWHVEDRPSHLVPLEDTGHGFRFLVFGGHEGGTGALRLVRRHTERAETREVRDLTVLVST